MARTGSVCRSASRIATKAEFPFIALIEHTNYMDRAHYGGDHLVYCGDYVPADHEYFKLSEEELFERFTGALTKFNPGFSRGLDSEMVGLPRAVCAARPAGESFGESAGRCARPGKGFIWPA